MGPYIYTFSKRGQYAGDTLGISQSYASCRVNTLCYYVIAYVPAMCEWAYGDHGSHGKKAKA